MPNNKFLFYSLGCKNIPNFFKKGVNDDVCINEDLYMRSQSNLLNEEKNDVSQLKKFVDALNIWESNLDSKALEALRYLEVNFHQII